MGTMIQWKRKIQFVFILLIFKQGASFEPPLTNVFTMQWYLTLFTNCLPPPVVLRVWDLIFLQGNEVLIRTALAIWAKHSK